MVETCKLPWCERTSPGRLEHGQRKRRESLSKRLGKTARLIKARDENACVYCAVSAEEAGAHLHLDHLTPKSAGGKDEAKNLVTACRRCNTARQNMTLAQWKAYAEVKFGIVFDPKKIRARARRKLS